MPSGGKFVNGTGSIATNGNKMDIAGNNKNNVIAWGGGFNIGKEASVNFTTNQKNYLNLDYTNKASQILGKLNGGTNNIYLVNPSGVLIGKDASINANKFGVSTSPFDNNAIQTFSKDGSFSPVFSANKGDIVNMGTISANEIVLVGNRVTNVENYVDEKGKKQVAFGSFNKKDSLTNTKLEITANHTDLHANRNTIGTIDSITVTAKGNNAKIEVGQSATGWTDVQLRINQNGNNVPTTTYASIKDTEDWSSFTDIINGGNANNIDTFKLIKDIDFKYAGAIEPVGNDTSNNPFSGNFYGNGHTLSNLLINADGKNSAGLFGYINGGSVQDLTIDGLNFQGSASVIGGFAGRIDNGTFSNIVFNNIGNISGGIAGGFAGVIGNGTSNIVLNNIVLNNIGDIVGDVVGGFAGLMNDGTLSNITLNNIENINSALAVSGFAGQIHNGTFSNIALNNIKKINGSAVGGFASSIDNGTFSNIILNKIENINGDIVGGFASSIDNGTFSNIVLNNIENISGILAGGFAGRIDNGTFSNIVLNNIGDISGSSSAGGFAGLGAGTFSNIVLNNIGNISDNVAGGFVGRIRYGTFSNIVLNNIGEINSELNSAGGFASLINNGGTFSNIVFNNIGNISGDHAGGSAGGFAGDGSLTSAADIYFYGAMNLSGNNTNQNHINSYNPTALNLTNTTDLQTIQNHMQQDSTLKNLAYFEKQNANGTTDSYLHMVTNGKIGGADSEITFDNEEYKLPKVSNNTTSPTPPSISNGDNLSSVTLVKDDFAVEVLKLIIDDILKQSFEFDLNHLSSLESILDEMDLNNLTTENIQTILMALLVNGDEANKESIKQTLDFYTEFNKGETDGLKSLFETWYKDAKDTYNISMDKHTYLIEKVKEIPNIIAEFKEVQESIKDYNDKVDLSERELKEAINIYEALLEEYKKLLASYDTDDSEFKNVFDTSYNAFQDNLKAFNAQLADYDAMLKDYNNGSVTYEDTLNAYKALTEKYKALINAHNSVKGSAEAYQNKNSTIKGEYANLVNKINALNEAFEVIQDKNYNFTAKHDELVGIKDALNLGKPTNYEGMTGGGFTFNGTLDLLGPKSNTNIPSQNDKPLLGGIDKPNSLDLGEFNSGFNVQLPEVPGNLPNSGDGANKVDVDNNLPTNLSRESLLSSKNSVITLPAQEKEDVITEDERELGRACIVSDNAKTNSPCVAAF
ncbi:filamentous hemagglutinin N-terminal domain-containing protein [Helicobacter sp.]|uniref:filamentous hemagglutinin N-terminal domain-containing protein n=1 Tax=Helicobacter sp. TaxID=218 RepID=UPI002584746F|nr:filamentous hemagglutinin N-terminal domain-containing protein [Helicobacter sp.]MCI7047728.1 filamentous hemagglutinin N-terminal domain-containing protein [Helicobacter sp.]